MTSVGRRERRRRRLPRARRLTRTPEIRRVFRRGKRKKTAHLDVFDTASPVPYARVGLVVPRHGHVIVDRNLLKRRLREILRRFVLPELDEAGLAIDVLVRARRAAYDASFDELTDEMREWTAWRCSRA